MATLEKIRSKAGLLVGIVGLALFAFIIGDFLNSGSTFFRQTKERIVSVDGEAISIQDYQNRIDELANVYKIQSQVTSLPEETMTQIRESVYESMVRETVLGYATERLGMEVSPAELFDMVQGENLSPLMRQIPVFQNEEGVFDKAKLLQMLRAMDESNIINSPADQQAQLRDLRAYWLFWEKTIKEQRLEEKYVALLSKAVTFNKLDALDNYNAGAETADIAYVAQNYAGIPDSTVTVSKSEIEKLYNRQKATYKVPETKIIDYITVDIVPNESDFEQVRQDISELRDEFIQTTAVADLSDLVNEHSDAPFTDVFSSANALDAHLKDFATTASVGETEGPALTDNTYRMFKLIAKKTAPDSVSVSHILIAGLTDEQTEAKVDSLLKVLNKGADFAAIAKEFSNDGRAASTGGELGWFTEIAALKGLNEDFKEALFSASLNELKTVKSLYGTHIIKVTQQTKPITKYKVADISIAVSPSSETYSNLYNKLNQYVSTNNTLAQFNANAQEAGYNLLANVSVTATDQTVGMLKSSRQVIRWAFEHKKNDISDIFECNDKFIVAAVSGSIAEGFRPLDATITASLHNELAAQKKGEKIVGELKTKNPTSLAAYAEAMNSRVDSVKFVGFNTARISGIGSEPHLNAMVSLAEQGQLSQPVIGNSAVYVFEVTNRNSNTGTFDEASQLRSMNGSFTYRFNYQAIQSLVDRAQVTDTRIRFY